MALSITPIGAGEFATGGASLASGVANRPLKEIQDYLNAALDWNGTRLQLFGNVGIATTSPQRPLHVNGLIRTANGAGIIMENNVGAEDAQIYENASNQLVLFIGASARVTIGTGIQVAAPTGGDKGSGTINAAGLYYANGTAGVASFGPAGVVSITVKNGLVTAIS